MRSKLLKQAETSLTFLRLCGTDYLDAFQWLPERNGMLTLERLLPETSEALNPNEEETTIQFIASLVYCIS
jgi:hypothetical protein